MEERKGEPGMGLPTVAALLVVLGLAPAAAPGTIRPGKSASWYRLCRVAPPTCWHARSHRR